MWDWGPAAATPDNGPSRHRTQEVSGSIPLCSTTCSSRRLLRAAEVRRAWRRSAFGPVLDAHVGKLHHGRLGVEPYHERPALRAHRLRRIGGELVAAAQASGRDRPMIEVQRGAPEEVVLAGEDDFFRGCLLYT